MKIQKLPRQNIRKRTLPAESVIIQLLDKEKRHLAFIACHHKYVFSLYNSENDRQTSQFLEEISNFEAELLSTYFQIAPEMEEKFGGWTGEMIITDKNSEIIHHEYSV
jgi:hypothetical protein